MSHYFTYSVGLVSGTVARSDDVNSRFQSVETGFGVVETDMGRTVRLTSDALSPISLSAASRAGKLLMFDGAGAIAASAALYANLSAGGFKITNLPTPATASEPVTLGYLGAYSASLAGIPSPTGHAGEFLSTDGTSVSWAVVPGVLPTQTGHGGEFLTTNGTVASWAAISQVSSIGNDRGVMLLHSGSAYAWALPMSNRIRNASGADGTTDWTLNVTGGSMTMVSEVATATNGAAAYGYHFKSGAPSASSATFRSEYIPANTGETWVASAEVLTGAISAGTIAIELRYYDAANALLGTFTQNFTASVDRRYQISGAAPSSTAKCAAVITWASATGGELYVRKVKVERNNYATPYNNDAAVQYVLAPRSSYTYGAQASLTVDYRSTTGSQTYDTRLDFSSGSSGVNGKGVMKITALRLEANCVIGFTSELDNGNSGAAITVDLGAAQNQKVTVNNNTTITLTAPAQVQTNRLKLIDSGGPRTITWAGASVTWVGGSSPSFSAAGKTVFVSIYYDGSGAWGQWVEV